MTKQFIKQVTVTGADDSISPINLLRLATVYPFLEFGLLVSKNNAGNSPRFPSQAWLDELRGIKRYGLYLSMHLCGTWVRSLCIGDGLIFRDWISAYFDMFDRIQLNFHGIPARANVRLVHGLRSFNKPIIFQLDGVNEQLYLQSKTYHIDSYPLYDLSGGAGILPNNWQKPQGDYCGYAGGLSPENLQEQLEQLSTIVGNTPIWIDAETHLRSNNDTLFDIDKVKRFIQIAQPYITPSKRNNKK